MNDSKKIQTANQMTQIDRIMRYAAMIERQAGKAVRPYRADGYVNLLNRYGTSKDTSESYKFAPEPAVADDILSMFYEGNGLFAKIIDAPAEEAIKNGFELKNISDQSVIDFCYEALDELDWEETAMTAIKWARLFGGSIAVMLINDGRGIDEPLDWSNIQSIDDIRIYDRSLITPDYSSMYSYDPHDPFSTRGSRLGMPEYYTVFSKYGNFTVHDSRCLVFQNGKLPENSTNSIYQLWGMPEYIRLHRAIRDAELAHSSGPKMLDKSVQAIYKMKNLATELASEEGEDRVLKRLQVIDMARGMLNSIAIDSEGEDYDFKSFQLAGVSDVIDSSCNFLSALTSIPQTILFGRSPAGMNSTGLSDLENWYNYVQRIQKRMLKGNLRYLLSVIFHAGLSTGEIEEIPKINVEFNPLWSASESEQADLAQKKAQVQQTKAQTAQVYVDMGALDPSEVRSKLSESEEFDVENMLDDLSDEELFASMPEEENENSAEGETATHTKEGVIETGNSSEAAPAATKLPQDMTEEEKEEAQEASLTDGADTGEETSVGVGVIVISEGKVLTGKRHNDFGYGLICGPGGHIDAGETPEQAAFRETEEEFGITPRELIPIGVCPADVGTGLESHIFLCTDFEGEPQCIDLEMSAPTFRTLEELDALSPSLFQPFADSLELLQDVLASNEDSESTDGGPGSGNHGHTGVIGKVGGSAPGPFDSSSVEIKCSRGADSFTKETKDAMLSLCGARTINPKTGDSDVEMTKKGFGDKARGLVSIDANGVQCQIDVDCDNKYISIDHLSVSETGKGKGTKIMTDIITEAKTQGFPKVELIAEGSKDAKENGYYTWARLGFDGELSQKQREKARSAGFEVSKVSELMSSDEGRSWWKENGSSIHLEFDLSDDSDSMKALSAYLNKDDASNDGGPGSGNHGHEGVEGQIGGSAPAGSNVGGEEHKPISKRSTPAVKSPNNFEAYVEENGLTPIYRGYSAESEEQLAEYRESYKNGTVPESGDKSSALGKGVYFSTSQSEAEGYMNRRKGENDHSKGRVTTAALDVDAKIADYNEMKKKKLADENEYIQKAFSAKEKGDTEEYTRMKDAYYSVAEMSFEDYVRSQGVDAISEPALGYIVVMNQNALVIRDDAFDLEKNQSTEPNISEKTIDKSEHFSIIKSKTSIGDNDDGGPGSGNHGHKGVKGQKGGSARSLSSQEKQKLSKRFIGQTTGDGVAIKAVSGHAFDRIGGRKLSAGRIENMVKNGTASPGNTPNTRCYDVKGSRMVLDTVTGKVITVMWRKNNK